MIQEPPALIAAATAQTGLSDFGPDGWQQGLERLVDAVGRDIGQDAAAIEVIEHMIVGRMATRLGIEAWYAEQDDAPPPVAGPLVIVGLPRSATTALHYLLAVDPRLRYTRSWETLSPLPPPDLATEHDDPRRAASRSRGDDVRHISTVDGPTEDGMIHALHFGHQEMALPVPTYTRWWRSADQTGMFAYQERVLQLLHAHRPPHHWLLKAPAYLFHLPEMGRQYPQAKFVMTHRDPTAVLPSACSTILDARQNVVPMLEHDKHAFGREQLEHWVEGVQRATDARAELGEDRFLDVSQQQVEQDPLGTVERIYAFAELDLTGDVQTAMSDWAAANRRGSRGAHRYTAEEFGLTADEIRDAFSEYCQRFDAYAGAHS